MKESVERKMSTESIGAPSEIDQLQLDELQIALNPQAE